MAAAPFWMEAPLMDGGDSSSGFEDEAVITSSASTVAAAAAAVSRPTTTALTPAAVPTPAPSAAPPVALPKTTPAPAPVSDASPSKMAARKGKQNGGSLRPAFAPALLAEKKKLNREAIAGEILKLAPPEGSTAAGVDPSKHPPTVNGGASSTQDNATELVTRGNEEKPKRDVGLVGRMPTVPQNWLDSTNCTTSRSVA